MIVLELNECDPLEGPHCEPTTFGDVYACTCSGTPMELELADSSTETIATHAADADGRVVVNAMCDTTTGTYNITVITADPAAAPPTTNIAGIDCV